MKMLKNVFSIKSLLTSLKAVVVQILTMLVLFVFLLIGGALMFLVKGTIGMVIGVIFYIIFVILALFLWGFIANKIWGWY